MLEERYNNQTLFDFEMQKVLKDGRYDLKKYKKKDNDYSDSEIMNIGFEVNKQNFIFNQAILFISSRYKDYKVYTKKIIDCGNYYFVSILGSPYKGIQFIFYKNGLLKSIVLAEKGYINCVDENTYVVFSENKRGIAKQVNIADNSFCYIKNVYSDILLSLDIRKSIQFGNLIGWFKEKNGNNSEEKKVLYNYKEKKVVVPEYYDVKYAYYDGADCRRRDDLLWVVYFCHYEHKFTFLEFLIDVDGKLQSNVHDFGRGIEYSISDRGSDQVEILNSIYKEAMDYLINSVNDNNIYSNLLRKKRRF